MDRYVAKGIIGGGQQGNRPASDYYPTPAEVTMALLDFLSLPKGTKVWEPACGENHMVNVMREYGLDITGTDINSGTDFLQAELIPCDWIITNPPFSLSHKFIERCIDHGKPFALLLKSQYWHAKSRLPLFRKRPPTYVCPLTWRPKFSGGDRPLMDVMWVIWASGDTRYVPLERPAKGCGEDG